MTNPTPILTAAAKQFSVTPDEILSDSKSRREGREVVAARKLAIVLLRQVRPTATIKAVGKAFGLHHSSILYHCDTFRAECVSDAIPEGVDYYAAYVAACGELGLEPRPPVGVGVANYENEKEVFVNPKAPDWKAKRVKFLVDSAIDIAIEEYEREHGPAESASRAGVLSKSKMGPASVCRRVAYALLRDTFLSTAAVARATHRIGSSNVRVSGAYARTRGDEKGYPVYQAALPRFKALAYG